MYIFLKGLSTGRVCFTSVLLLVYLTATLPGVLVASATSEVKPAESPVTMTDNSTCADWMAWMPPSHDPAVILQVVTSQYTRKGINFIKIMEKNSGFTRYHLFLICVDNEETIRIFADTMGVRCIPFSHPQQKEPTGPHQTVTEQKRYRWFVWKLRLTVLRCLLEVNHVDVIMSDADALWVGDVVQELFPSPQIDRDYQREVQSSDLVASRGNFPYYENKKWGSTMCMGFIIFRQSNIAAMTEFLDVMQGMLLKVHDDQVAINRAANHLGIAWDKDSDMRFDNSSSLAVGAIESLPADKQGRPFTVVILPQRTYMRKCPSPPLPEDLVVAHCFGAKISWLKEANLWSE